MTNQAPPFGWRREAPAEPLDLPKLMSQWDDAVATLAEVQAACQSMERVVNINDPNKPSWFPLDNATYTKVSFIQECDLPALVWNRLTPDELESADDETMILSWINDLYRKVWQRRAIVAGIFFCELLRRVRKQHRAHVISHMIAQVEQEFPQEMDAIIQAEMLATADHKGSA